MTNDDKLEILGTAQLVFFERAGDGLEPSDQPLDEAERTPAPIASCSRICVQSVWIKNAVLLCI